MEGKGLTAAEIKEAFHLSSRERVPADIDPSNDPEFREKQVLAALHFLKNPSVASFTREKCTEFLVGKGLTTEEIGEAYKRMNSGDSHFIEIRRSFTRMLFAPSAMPVETTNAYASHNSSENIMHKSNSTVSTVLPKHMPQVTCPL